MKATWKLLPGGIETPLQNEFTKMPEGVSWKEFRKVMTPLGNSQPEEIANIAIFVASLAQRLDRLRPHSGGGRVDDLQRALSGDAIGRTVAPPSQRM